MNLVFDTRVVRDALLFLEITNELIKIDCTALQKSANALKDLDFSLELF